MGKIKFVFIFFAAFTEPVALYAMESNSKKIDLGKELIDSACVGYWTCGANCFGDDPSVRGLILRGADLNQTDSNGWTALMIAVGAWYNEEIAKMLIKGRINLAMRNNHGETALLVAAKKNHLSICFTIVDAMIAQQKECVFTFLNCLKRLDQEQYKTLRDVFKFTLQEMLGSVHREINMIEDVHIRQQLLGKYILKSSL